MMDYGTSSVAVAASPLWTAVFPMLRLVRPAILQSLFALAVGTVISLRWCTR